MSNNKYISIDKRNKKNPYRVRVYDKKTQKVRHVGRFKDLEDAITKRDKFLLKMDNEDKLLKEEIPW